MNYCNSCMLHIWILCALVQGLCDLFPFVNNFKGKEIEFELVLLLDKFWFGFLGFLYLVILLLNSIISWFFIGMIWTNIRELNIYTNQSGLEKCSSLWCWQGWGRFRRQNCFAFCLRIWRGMIFLIFFLSYKIYAFINNKQLPKLGCVTWVATSNGTRGKSNDGASREL